MRRRRSRPTVAEIIAATESSSWQLSKGTAGDGLPLFIRINTAYADAADTKRYPIEIEITLPLNHPNEHGLPHDEAEFDQLDTAEVVVIEHAGANAALVGVVTTHSMREFYLYTDRVEWVEGFCVGLRDAIDTHEVHAVAQEDPEWSVYHHVLQ